VREGGVIVDSGGHWKGLGIGAEFQRTTKMIPENEGKMEVKMRIFAKWGGMVHFSKYDHFQLILMFICEFIFEKWKKNEK